MGGRTHETDETLTRMASEKPHGISEVVSSRKQAVTGVQASLSSIAFEGVFKNFGLLTTELSTTGGPHLLLCLEAWDRSVTLDV